MKFKIRLFITLTLVFFLPSAFALCTGGNSMQRNYDGTIGNKYKVRATMTIEGNNIDGVYFYRNRLAPHIKKPLIVPDYGGCRNSLREAEINRFCNQFS